jgi:hypothetical protein
MFKGFFPILCAATALLPAAAWGDPPTGSRVDRTPGAVRTPANDEINSQQIMRTFAMCVARARPQLAAGVLALPYLSPEQSGRVHDRLGGSHDCMGRTAVDLSFRAPSILEGFAAQLVQQRFATADLGPVSAWTDEQVIARGLRPRNGYEDFSLCMVRTQPALIRAYVLTEPGSAEEQASYRQVLPHIGSCVAAGQTLSLDRRGVRSVLAVGLYRVLDKLQIGN